MTLAALIAVAALADYRAQFPLPGPKFGDGWGVNIHFTTPAPGEMDKIQSAGFRWVRMDLFWHQIERSKGKYDFSQYDVLMSELCKRKMRPIFILDYGNDLYQAGSPRTPEARAAFCRFVEAAVSRYRGKGVLWEMWNEPNIHFWQPKPNADEYILLAKEVGRTIRRIAPSEWYVGPATSGFDWTFLEKCFKAGLLEQLDAVTVHPYRAAEPETVATDWANLELLIDRYKPAGKPRPMISGEWGYSDINLAGGVYQQGEYAVRQYMTNLSCGVNLSIWYDWKDDGTDPKEPEHHFGLVKSNLSDKDGYVLVERVGRSFKGYTFLARYFKPRGYPMEMAWTKSGSALGASWQCQTRIHPVEPLFEKWTRPYFGVQELKPMDRPNAAIQSPILYTDGKDLIEQLWPTTPQLQVVSGDGAHYLYRGSPDPTKLDRRDWGPIWIHFGPPGQSTTAVLAMCKNPLSLSIFPGRSGWELQALSPFGKLGNVVVDDSGGRRLSTTSVVRLPGEDTQTTEEEKRPFLVRLRSTEAGTPIVGEIGPIFATSVFGDDHQWEWSAEGDEKVRASLSSEMAVRERYSKPYRGRRFRYNFAPGWRYACLKPVGTKPLPGTPRQFCYWLYGDGQGHMLRMRFQDATGQTFQPDHGPIDWKGWRWIVFNLDQSAQGRWGGANDGVIHYPIRIETAVLVDSMGGRGGKGEIFATDFTVFGS